MCVFKFKKVFRLLRMMLGLGVFNPELFIEAALNHLERNYSDIDCAIACISGGVDSVTTALIAKRALKDKVLPVFIDTGLMRYGEPEAVKNALSGVIDLTIYDYSNSIVSNLSGLSDAEEKRKVFRDLFYSAVSNVARRHGCSYVVQGTTKADVVETLGGVKTQHNVLTQELLLKYGVKVIEPLRDLYKYEVKALAYYLGLPSSIVQRQPFPGPGLLIRAVGKFHVDKLSLVRYATKIVDERLSVRNYSQYFPAVWEYDVINEGYLGNSLFKVFSVKTTGVVGGSRVYGHPILIEDFNKRDVVKLHEQFDVVKHPHILISLASKDSGKYFIAVRVVETRDYVTASVPVIERSLLLKLAEELLENPDVKAVGYDVTPKPPATIEYE